jgi:hypothetical protein
METEFHGAKAAVIGTLLMYQRDRGGLARWDLVVDAKWVKTPRACFTPKVFEIRP